MLYCLAYVNLALRGLRAVDAAPFAKLLPLVVTVPESAVKNCLQPFVPCVLLLLGEFAGEVCFKRLVVASGNGAYIFRAARTPLNLEHAHSAFNHAVDEAYCLKVLWRHNVLVVYLKFNVALAVLYNVSPAAHLHALAAVGAAAKLVERHVAFARDCHAERAVAEHFNAYELPFRAADVLVNDNLVYGSHLVHVQLAGKHHDIGELGVELERLAVADVELGGEMNLHAHTVAVLHYGNVGRNYSRNAALLCRIYYIIHQCQVVLVNNGVYSEVAFYPMGIAYLRNLPEVANGERACRMGAHVKVLNAKVY